MSNKELDRRFFEIVHPLQAEYDVRCRDMRHDELFEVMVHHYMVYSDTFLNSPEHHWGRTVLTQLFNVTPESVDEQLWAAADDLYVFCEEMNRAF